MSKKLIPLNNNVVGIVRDKKDLHYIKEEEKRTEVLSLEIFSAPDGKFFSCEGELKKINLEVGDTAWLPNTAKLQRLEREDKIFVVFNQQDILVIEKKD